MVPAQQLKEPHKTSSINASDTINLALRSFVVTYGSSKTVCRVMNKPCYTTFYISSFLCGNLAAAPVRRSFLSFVILEAVPGVSLPGLLPGHDLMPLSASASAQQGSGGAAGYLGTSRRFADLTARRGCSSGSVAPSRVPDGSAGEKTGGKKGRCCVAVEVFFMTDSLSDKHTIS